MSRKTIRVALVVCITCLLICTVASAEETLALYAGDGDTGALFTGDYEAGVRYSGTGSASVTTPASNALTPTSGWNVTTIDSSGNSNVYVSLGSMLPESLPLPMSGLRRTAPGGSTWFMRPTRESNGKQRLSTAAVISCPRSVSQ